MLIYIFITAEPIDPIKNRNYCNTSTMSCLCVSLQLFWVLSVCSAPPHQSSQTPVWFLNRPSRPSLTDIRHTATANDSTRSQNHSQSYNAHGNPIRTLNPQQRPMTIYSLTNAANDDLSYKCTSAYWWWSDYSFNLVIIYNYRKKKAEWTWSRMKLSFIRSVGSIYQIQFSSVQTIYNMHFSRAV